MTIDVYGIVMTNDTETSKEHRDLREDKLKTHIALKVTPSNMEYFCLRSGIMIPESVEFDDFEDWLDEYLGNLDDNDIVTLMEYFELAVNFDDFDRWNGVFVIHSSADEAYAKSITKGMNYIGIPDSRIYCSSVESLGTDIGESFHTIIKGRILAAKVVICLMSDRSVKSQYCLQEMGACMIQDIPIIPVFTKGFDPADMPGFMDNTRYQGIDVNSDGSKEKFLRKISDICCLKVSDADVGRAARAMLMGE